MADNGGARILTIDDEADIRASFRRFLAEYGHEVIEAEDGDAGLAAFRRARPDLVLVDLRMPGIGGLDVIAAIKEESPETPVIVVSGTGNISDAIEALRLGAWDYLLKPVQELAVLRHAVDNALERARLMGENRRYQERLEEEIAKRTKELAAALERLRASELRYRTVADFTYDWEYWERPDGSFEYVSPSCERISGYRPDDFMKDPGLFLKIVHPADRPLWREHHHRAGSPREPREVVLRIVTADGETRWIEHVCQPIFDDQGRFLGFRASNRDVTRREHMANELRQAQKLEAIGTMAGGIAHDFNNILTPIFGYTEFALEHLDAPDKLREDLEEISRAARRARSLVGQILTISRKTEEQRRPVEAALIVKEALKLIRAMLPATIAVEQDVSARGLVLADPTHIHQVVMNLCTNAFHAMRGREGVLRVGLRDIGDGEGEFLELTVADNGCGMDKDVVSHIFDPYFTTKPPGEGTGLGLAVVRGIVDGHGGRILVDSAPGRGTVFTVLFPRHAAGETAGERGDDGGRCVPGRERVMVVDDEEAIVRMVRDVLATYGYRVTVFTDPAAALDAFEACPGDFDLVLTDMTMPSMTGDRLAARLLAIRPDLPVIIATGYSETMDRAGAEAVGAAAFLDKPLEMRRVMRTIRDLLDAGREGDA